MATFSDCLLSKTQPPCINRFPQEVSFVQNIEITIELRRGSAFSTPCSAWYRSYVMTIVLQLLNYWRSGILVKKRMKWVLKSIPTFRSPFNLLNLSRECDKLDVLAYVSTAFLDVQQRLWQSLQKWKQESKCVGFDSSRCIGALISFISNLSDLMIFFLEKSWLKLVCTTHNRTNEAVHLKNWSNIFHYSSQILFKPGTTWDTVPFYLINEEKAFHGDIRCANIWQLSHHAYVQTLTLGYYGLKYSSWKPWIMMGQGFNSTE